MREAHNNDVVCFTCVSSCKKVVSCRFAPVISFADRIVFFHLLLSLSLIIGQEPVR